MADVIEDMFAEEGVFIRYPGSSKRIRHGGASSYAGPRVMPTTDPIFDKENWRRPTFIEIPGTGKKYPFYRPIVFANVIGKAIHTIKFWEQNGLIPKPPFRFKHESTARNYYTEESITAFLTLLNQRGLLYESRIPWSMFPELPGEIAKEWKRVQQEFFREAKLDVERNLKK